MPASTQKRPRQYALSEPGSPKRPRTITMGHSSPKQPALQSSDRATSPITSRTATSSSSSPGTSDDERNAHTPARASSLTRQRNTQPQPRGQGEDDDISSDESTSSESASSDEERDEDEEEENDPSVPRLPAMQKPQIHRVDKQPGLLARVSSFLPRMKDANDSLQRDIAAGRASDVMVDDVGDGHEGRYIEMNLGLGVLEEKHSDDDDASSSGDEGDSDAAEQSQGSSRDSNVLGRLMGKESASTKPTIEEVNQ
ncbi:hypothetical protein PHISP_04440 [Aspergillus sp. HF37]|nr:hypothetical protein PHISP_04440 [Aspergillus sp. HF37]